MCYYLAAMVIISFTEFQNVLEGGMVKDVSDCYLELEFRKYG